MANTWKNSVWVNKQISKILNCRQFQKLNSSATDKLHSQHLEISKKKKNCAHWTKIEQKISAKIRFTTQLKLTSNSRTVEGRECWQPNTQEMRMPKLLSMCNEYFKTNRNFVENCETKEAPCIECFIVISRSNDEKNNFLKNIQIAFR